MLQQKALDEGQLFIHLRAAQNGHEGMLGGFHGAAHNTDLIFDEETAHRRQIIGHPGGRGVGPMGRAEGIVDEDLGHGGKLFGKGGVILLLLGAEADVLQQHDLAGLERRGHGLGQRADDVLGQRDVHVQKFPQPLRNGLKAHGGVDLSLWAAQVRAQDDRRFLLQQIADGGKRAADANIIGDLALIVHRHVEVATEKYFLSGNVDVRYGLLVIIHGSRPRNLSVFCWFSAVIRLF